MKSVSLSALLLFTAISAFLSPCAGLGENKKVQPESLSSEGFVRSWLVLGPFSNENRETKDYLADMGGESKAEPKEGQAVAGRTWKKMEIASDGLLELLPRDHVVYYAFALLDAHDKCDMLFRLGVDDGYIFWVNGQKVAERHTAGSLDPDREQVVACLKPGLNRILLKIDNRSGRCGFFFRLVELSQAPNIAPKQIRTWTAQPEGIVPEWRQDLGIAIPAGVVNATVTVTSEPISQEVSPLMFGSNLNWMEGNTSPKVNSTAWDLYRDMGLTALRFPGGWFCHPYRWESLAETRRVMNATKQWEDWIEKYPSKGFYDYKTFLDLCGKHGIEPILQVSTMLHWDPKTRQVTWMNGSTDTNRIEACADYAAAWVRDAKKSGYAVKYWEIGNEEYFYPRMNGEVWGQMVSIFANKMKEADPDIQVMAAGWARDWTAKLLQRTGKKIDYLTYHGWPGDIRNYTYPPGIGIRGEDYFTEKDLETADWNQLYLAHLAVFLEGKKMLEHDLFQPLREYPNVKLAWTEYNWPAWKFPFNFSIAQALLNTEQILHMAKKNCQIGLFYAVSASNFCMTEWWKKPPYYPMGDAFRLLRRYVKGRFYRVEVNSPTVQVRRTATPLVSAHLCKTDKSWALILLNHHPTESARITVHKVPGLAQAPPDMKRVDLVSKELTLGEAANRGRTDRHEVLETTMPRCDVLTLDMAPHSMTILAQDKGSDQ